MYCPKCNAEVGTADEECLCVICGWFGDRSETMIGHYYDTFNPLRAAAAILETYREICRKELILEQMYDSGDATGEDIRKIELERRGTVHGMMDMFCKLRAKYETVPIEEIAIGIDGTAEWPDAWSDYVRNGNDGGACDTLIGPCICGGTHKEEDQWVIDKMRLHRARFSRPEFSEDG